MDRSVLREALEYGPPSDDFDKVGKPNGFLQTVHLSRQEFDAIVAYRAAARAVVEAPEWVVCEQHKSRRAFGSSMFCEAAVLNAAAEPCGSMVVVYLVPKEQE